MNRRNFFKMLGLAAAAAVAAPLLLKPKTVSKTVHYQTFMLDPKDIEQGPWIPAGSRVSYRVRYTVGPNPQATIRIINDSQRTQV